MAYMHIAIPLVIIVTIVAYLQLACPGASYLPLLTVVAYFLHLAVWPLVHFWFPTSQHWFKA